MKKYLSALLLIVMTIMFALVGERADMSAATSGNASSLKALDYTNQDNWAIKDISSQKSADVFFICPTVDMGAEGNLNMSMDDETVKNNFVGATNMEKGIYDVDANFYAPYYRQITFPVYSMDEKDAAEALDIAYCDVRAAFEQFLKETDKDRPIILAGFSQGSQMMLRLMEECFGDKKLQERLVAAYAIGWRVTDEDIKRCSHLKLAQKADDTGVIIAFEAESGNIKDSIIVPEGVYTYAINPLNWKTDNTVADASLNTGACFTDYSGAITKEALHFCGAYLDPVRGTLTVTGVTPADYPGLIFEDGVYHLYDYQFFYRNLQENVAERIEAWKRL